MGYADPADGGDAVNCQNPVVLGVAADGGYAEVVIAEARGISSIPDGLGSAEAAPLLCAGVTTYNGLRNAGLRWGDLVAEQESYPSSLIDEGRAESQRGPQSQ